MSFSKVKGVRIKSLLPGAVVELRFGKAAVRMKSDPVVQAKLIRHYEKDSKLMADFQEVGVEGSAAVTTISRFPGAAWRDEKNHYVSLVGVDESTVTLAKGAAPIATTVIGEAIEWVKSEADDVFGADQLIALLTEVKDGKRVNTKIKALAIEFATKLVSELSASAPDSAGVPGE